MAEKSRPVGLLGEVEEAASVAGMRSWQKHGVKELAVATKQVTHAGRRKGWLSLKKETRATRGRRPRFGPGHARRKAGWHWALCGKEIYAGPSDGTGLCWADVLRNGLELGLNWIFGPGPKIKKIR